MAKNKSYRIIIEDNFEYNSNRSGMNSNGVLHPNGKQRDDSRI